jgi:hypothetical protein
LSEALAGGGKDARARIFAGVECSGDGGIIHVERL